MKLKLIRVIKEKDFTVGELYLDNVMLCNTLEPPYFGTTSNDTIEHIKALKNGNTAIPTGEYTININIISPKFKNRSWAKPYGGKIPTIENVKGYDRVLIHVGNKASQFGPSDTQACVLVGDYKKGKVINSTACFMELMTILLKAHLKGENITLTIV